MKRLFSISIFLLVSVIAVHAQMVAIENEIPKASGQVTDVSGDYAIIGSPAYVGQNGNKMGEANIFFKNEAGWKLQARLVAPDSINSKFYASDVAICGDYCVVSDFQKATNISTYKGKIYVYKRNGTTWNLESTKIEPVDNEQFGYTVAVTINSSNIPLVVVGAPSANGKGKVYIYTKNNAIWNLSQTIAPNDLKVNNKFGSCVSVDKDYLAIGAPHQDYAVYDIIDAGAVYAFALDGGVFSQQQKMVGYYPNGEFGSTLSLFGNKIAVGSAWASSYGSTKSTASVAVLKRNGTRWDDSFSDFEVPYNSGNNMQTSLQLSLNDNQLLIGEPTGIIFPPSSSLFTNLPPSAYLYATKDGGATYQLTKKVVSPMYNGGDFSQQNIALDAARK